MPPKMKCQYRDEKFVCPFSGTTEEMEEHCAENPLHDPRTIKNTAIREEQMAKREKGQTEDWWAAFGSEVSRRMSGAPIVGKGSAERWFEEDKKKRRGFLLV